MLDELFPVQFVEGLNEGAEPSDEGTIVITSYMATGLQYTPQVSYVLTRLEIMLTFGDIPDGTQMRVDLCSDYDEKPSDIVLSSGNFIPEKGALGGWQEVKLNPVSVIRNRKYWVTIHPNRCPIAFIKAEKGQGFELSVKTDNRWKIPPDHVKVGEVMMKFYGRILSISG